MRPRVISFLVGAVFLLLVTGRLITVPIYCERILSYILYPIMQFQRVCVTSLRTWAATRATQQELLQTIEQLQQEKEELLSNVIRLQALLGFAADTKELMIFRQRYDNAHAILAQVLMKNLSDQAQFFMLDAGESKGVKKNMVVVYKDHLLGKIIEVYPFYSKALLITDRACKVSAYCAQTKAQGIYGGTNNERITSLAHVSHLAPLAQGDRVLSTGDGLVFPRGFSLGTVTDFKRNDLYYDITVTLSVDMRKISYCYILQKDSEAISYAADTVPTITRAAEELLYIRARAPETNVVDVSKGELSTKEAEPSELPHEQAMQKQDLV